MKKILLTLASAFLAFSGFAQDNDETEGQITVQPEGWSIEVNLQNPSSQAGITYIKMEPAGTHKNGYDTYTILVPIQTFPNESDSKYFLTVKYKNTEENIDASWILGSPNGSTNGTSITRNKDEQPLNIAITAWYNTTSNKIEYIDSYINIFMLDLNDWVARAVWDRYRAAEDNVRYFVLDDNENKFNLRKNLSTTSGINNECFIAGKDTENNYTLNSPQSVTKGVYKATIDYSTLTVNIEKATTITTLINNYGLFVAPVDVTIPDNISVYELNYLQDGLVGKKIEGIIPAATPVVLKADESDYTLSDRIISFEISGDEYTFEKSSRKVNNNDRFYIADPVYNLNEDEAKFIGTYQSHYLPSGVDAYIFDKKIGSFKIQSSSVNMSSGSDPNILIPGFWGYLTLPSNAWMEGDDLSSLEINFDYVEPEEPAGFLYIHFTDEDGYHLQTHFVTLTYDYNNGVYTNNNVDVGDYEYYVFSTATFDQPQVSSYAFPNDYPQNKPWNELNEDAIIYHLAENAEVLSDDDDEDEDVQPAEPVTKNIVATKVSALTAANQNPTPIPATSLIHTITLDPAGTLTTVVNDDQTTGIENVIVNEPSTQDNRIFNIYGQQVDETYKGIIIKNGKKVYNR